jgi:hypothetical protein
MIDKNIFITAGVISVLFFILKLSEIKMVLKEDIDLKMVLKDTLIVFCSVVTGTLLVDQLKPMIYENAEKLIKNPPIFTDLPSF